MLKVTVLNDHFPGLPPLPVSLVLGTGGVDVKIQWLMRAVHILAEANAKLETRLSGIEGKSSADPSPSVDTKATTEKPIS